MEEVRKDILDQSLYGAMMLPYIFKAIRIEGSMVPSVMQTRQYSELIRQRTVRVLVL